VHPVNYCFACKKRGQEAKWFKIKEQITTPCISVSEQESTNTRELAFIIERFVPEHRVHIGVD
jgi:hypothetical protein